jgi:phage portal protein BeeE
VNLLTRLLRREPEIARYNVGQYIEDLSQAYGGYRYLGSPGWTKTEDIETSFTGYINGLYKSNGIVFAIVLARMLLFTEARFCWFEVGDNGENGRPKGRDGLELLESPWPNCGTGELLARMEQDVSLGGNFYAVREGSRLRRLRPDWVTIVLTAPPAESTYADVAGYWYHPGRSYTSAGEPGPGDDVYLPDEICHWSPLPDPDAQYRGMSWLTPAIKEVQADKAASDHKLSFFQNGATLGVIISAKESLTNQQYKEWKANFEGIHSGAGNAYKSLFLASPVDTSVLTANMQQLDFKVVQGAGETRLCALGGVPPIIVGLSEGLASATYSNYGMARRKFGDHWGHPQWRSAAQALSSLVDPPSADVRLGVNTKGIAFLREDAKDLAEIEQIKASTLSTLIMAGYEPDSCVAAVEAEDLSLLKHTGLTSVQLVPPGSDPALVAEEEAADAEEYDVLLDEFRAELFDEDEIQRDRYEVRNPRGSVGGGRFRKLSDAIVALLKDWNGEGDPLDGWTQPQLKKAATQLGIDVPPRSSAPKLKSAILAHARKGDRKPDVREAKPERKPLPGSDLMLTPRGVKDRQAHADGEKLDVQNIQPGDEVQDENGEWHTLAAVRSVDRVYVAGFDEDGNQVFRVADYRRLPTRKGKSDVKSDEKLKPKAPAKKATSTETPADVVAKLREAKNRDEAREILAGKTIPQLREIADAAGVTLGRQGKENITSDLIYGAVIRPRDSRALRDVDLSTPASREADRLDREAAKKATPRAPAKKAAPKAEVAKVNSLREQLARIAEEARPLGDMHQRYAGLRNPTAADHAEFDRVAPRLRELRREGATIARQLLDELGERDGEPWGGDPDADSGRWGSPVFVDRGTEDRDALRRIRDRYVADDTNTVTQNRSLRSGNPTPEAQAWAQRMSRLVRSSELDRDARLYRGRALTPDQVMALRPGAVVVDAGIVSTDRDPGGALAYAVGREERIPGRIQTLYEIRVPRGTAAVEVGDGEVVLDRDQRFRIVASHMGDDGIAHVVMELDNGAKPDSVTLARQRQADIDTARNARADAALERLSEVTSYAEARELLVSTTSEDDRFLIWHSRVETLQQKLAVSGGETDEGIINRLVSSLVSAARRREGPAPIVATQRDTFWQLPKAKRDAVRQRVTDPKDRNQWDAALKREAPDVLDSVQKARVRQDDIDTARGYADAAAQLDELLANEASTAALLSRLDNAGKRHGIADDLAPVRAAVDAGDMDKARAAMAAILSARGITQDGKAGDTARFTRGVHQPIDSDLREGQAVETVRPGFTLSRDGEQIRLSKATVEAAGEPNPYDKDDPFSRVMHRDSAPGIVEQLGQAKTEAEAGRILAIVPPFRLALVAEAAGVSVGDDDSTEKVRAAVIRKLVTDRQSPAPDLSSLDTEDRSPEGLAAKLAQAQGRTEAREMLDGLTMAQLRALGDHLDVAPQRNKTEQRDAIVEATAGVRADAAGILGADTGSAKKTLGRLADERLAGLDTEDLRDTLDLKSVDQLKDMIRDRNKNGAKIKLSGRKRELVDRLVEAMVAGREAPDARALELGEAPTARPRLTPAEAAQRIRRLTDVDDILEEIRDLRAADVRALAEEFNITIPVTAKSASVRKRHIAQSLAAHNRRTTGGLGRSEEPDPDDIVRADYDDEPDEGDPGEPDDEQRARAQTRMDEIDDEDEEEPEDDYDAYRAAGMDTNLGGERLHYWWTKGPGLKRWVGSPHPWTTLYRQLLEKVGNPGKAKRMASRWFIEVFGYAAGSDKHRVASGKPPRGDVIGPG